MNEPLFVLDINQFFVDAGFDVNDGRIIKPRGLRDCVDSFLNSFKVTAASAATTKFVCAETVDAPTRIKAIAAQRAAIIFNRKITRRASS
jgi:hypothetical protein